MDEGLLNDLLECSVCLERLDTSSRVLPCQHTFCLKCLKIKHDVSKISGETVTGTSMSVNEKMIYDENVTTNHDVYEGTMPNVTVRDANMKDDVISENHEVHNETVTSVLVLENKVIVESHKELRCPECRVLVEARVEELPPNVLLMRILEGMKNSAPRRALGVGQRLKSGHSQSQALQAAQMAHKDKQLPPHARAMYDFMSKEPGDLSFKKGETILLQKKLDAFWYQGECAGRTGMFPITYVQVAVPLPVPTALCKALYDFRMSAPDEEGCLAFDKGAIITVHRRVDENWAEGRLEQRVGIFPIAFVELNQPARHLMNSTPLNRPVPPLPDQARAGHSDHRHHAQHSHRYQPMTMSTPATVQSNYQNMATMSQSHPNYHGHMVAPHPPVPIPTATQHPALVTTTAVPRNIIEPAHTKHSLDLIHFTNMHNKASGMMLQSVSRIGENYDRLRSVKFDSYNSTPVHKVDTTYQNVRTEHFPVSIASFNTNNVSSDSSSSMNTPSVGVSSATTPNTSSDTSTCESNEPSLPSSPDNNTERNPTVISSVQEEATVENLDASLNTSMGVLSLNESSTATNTSLNVSLPPTESPKLNSSAQENVEPTSSEVRLDVPSSSNAMRSSGPDSLLNFGLGLQAALSPSHCKDGYLVRGHREHQHHRDKRHSLTPTSHLQGNHSSQNRHSAEIVATSLLDASPGAGGGAARGRRRRGSRSAERGLPAPYVALYPYKPQKPDELELAKGGMYTVTERCRDGWYKGRSERSQRCGVFPGNYVAPAAHKPHRHDKSGVSLAAAAPVRPAAPPAPPAPPDAPPRAHSPTAAAQPLSYPWTSPPQVQPQLTTPRSEKPKEKPKAEKSSLSSGVSLMRRLAAMKKCKSPPPAYSMDNPVFEDAPGPSAPAHHPVHVRSGSCPSQLLRNLPAPSDRARHKERSLLATQHAAQQVAQHAAQQANKHRAGNPESPWQTQHRKSQSLDVTATRRDRHHSQNVKERFRCIVPYPPNSEYELELQLDDIVLVSRKRGDGWYKGTLQRTGRSGLFPASFVQSCPLD